MVRASSVRLVKGCLSRRLRGGVMYPLRIAGEAPSCRPDCSFAYRKPLELLRMGLRLRAPARYPRRPGPKVDELRRQLSWTHYHLLVRVDNPDARSSFLDWDLGPRPRRGPLGALWGTIRRSFRYCRRLLYCGSTAITVFTELAMKQAW